MSSDSAATSRSSRQSTMASRPAPIALLVGIAMHGSGLPARALRCDSQRDRLRLGDLERTPRVRRRRTRAVRAGPAARRRAPRRPPAAGRSSRRNGTRAELRRHRAARRWNGREHRQDDGDASAPRRAQRARPSRGVRTDRPDGNLHRRLGRLRRRGHRRLHRRRGGGCHAPGGERRGHRARRRPGIDSAPGILRRVARLAARQSAARDDRLSPAVAAHLPAQRVAADSPAPRRDPASRIDRGAAASGEDDRRVAQHG